MSTSILATKLYVPSPRPKVVLRPRLIDRLSEGLHRKLTLISAPAGFGKTSLVSEWIQTFRQESTPSPAVAWLSLDEGDNDPARFLAYLVATLQKVTPQIGAGIMGLRQSPQLPTETALTILLNEITAIPDNFLLVLDDYHVIDAKPVDQALAFLLEHLPPQMHLVITTREDPQLPLARLRARGQMTELRATDLRFTPAEAAGFLNQVMGLGLSSAEVTILEARTEGWIAGLQLAALSMQGRVSSAEISASSVESLTSKQGTPGVAHFVKAFAGDNRYIVDYLVEEVLQRQPERVRSFLLQTAMLDRLSGGLCDAVTGQNDGLVLLDALERGNLFVVPLDDTRHWFRYHHLFADVLAAHALQEQPAQVPILHQRASAWYAANGLPADAIRHALAAKDFACAAGLIEQAWPAMDGRFQTATWLGWAGALPDELIRTRPVLSVAYAWALLNGGDLEAAAARFEDAERWLDAGLDPEAARPAQPGAPSAQIVAAPRGYPVIVDEEQFRNLPASIATARAYIAQASGDLPGSVKYGRRALNLLPEGDYLRRGPAAALLGLAQWASGDLEAAYHALAAAMTGFQKIGNLHFATSVTSGLADIRTVQGRLREAIECYAKALQLVLAQGEPLIRGTANLYLGLSELYHEQGNQEVAIQHLLHSEELGDQAGLPDWRYRLYRTQARFKEAEGDLSGALDRIDAAERHHRRTPVPDLRPLAALKARVWVAQGRLSEALRWAQEQGLSVDDELSFLREFEHITLARVLIAQHQRDQTDGSIHAAMKLLARLLPAAEAGGRTGSVLEILVLQALAHEAQGNLPFALAPLKRALTLAEPEGYVRLFVDEGLPMARLLAAAAQGMLADRIRSGYIKKLLAAFEDATMDGGPTPEPSPASFVLRPASLVEPLSDRELEVLKLLGTELNGPEIARRLMVSLNTMRTHTKNIYNKLGVNDRRAATRRAEELGLY
ncbi:MAG: tetratricopeptide repeat protein [Chloroflexi bacterium]|nr:tetratricopeptide repeat protein [Chloroflexota bacterium]